MEGLCSSTVEPIIERTIKYTFYYETIPQALSPMSLLFPAGRIHHYLVAIMKIFPPVPHRVFTHAHDYIEV